MAKLGELFHSKRSSFHPEDSFSSYLASLRLLFRLRTTVQGVNVPDQLESSPAEFPSEIDPGALCEHLVGLLNHLRPLLPGSCEWLERGALEFVGEHPIDAGGVADVRVGKLGDSKIAIKVYRCYSSSNYLPSYAVSGAYIWRAIRLLKFHWQRFYEEALACSRLKDRNIVPFIGVYSTPKHPLALVFELMDHLNLREYLRSDKDVGRCKLVRLHYHIHRSSY